MDRKVLRGAERGFREHKKKLKEREKTQETKGGWEDL